MASEKEEKPKQNQAKSAREALEAWLKNCQYLCQDPKGTRWQSDQD